MISDNFACTLLRYPGSGDLQIVSRHEQPASGAAHAGQESGMATLYVDGVDGGWFLKGETEV